MTLKNPYNRYRIAFTVCLGGMQQQPLPLICICVCVCVCLVGMTKVSITSTNGKAMMHLNPKVLVSIRLASQLRQPSA